VNIQPDYAIYVFRYSLIGCGYTLFVLRYKLFSGEGQKGDPTHRRRSNVQKIRVIVKTVLHYRYNKYENCEVPHLALHTITERCSFCWKQWWRDQDHFTFIKQLGTRSNARPRIPPLLCNWLSHEIRRRSRDNDAWADNARLARLRREPAEKLVLTTIELLPILLAWTRESNPSCPLDRWPAFVLGFHPTPATSFRARNPNRYRRHRYLPAPRRG